MKRFGHFGASWRRTAGVCLDWISDPSAVEHSTLLSHIRLRRCRQRIRDRNLSAWMRPIMLCYRPSPQLVAFVAERVKVLPVQRIGASAGYVEMPFTAAAAINQKHSSCVIDTALEMLRHQLPISAVQIRSTGSLGVVGEPAVSTDDHIFPFTSLRWEHFVLSLISKIPKPKMERNHDHQRMHTNRKGRLNFK